MRLYKKLFTVITLAISLVFPIQTSFAQSFSFYEDSFDSGYYKDADGALVETNFEDSLNDWETDFENTSMEWREDFEEITNDWEFEFEDTLDTTLPEINDEWADTEFEFPEWELETPSFEWDNDFDFEDPWDNDDDTPPEEEEYTRGEARAEINKAEAAAEELGQTIQQMEVDEADEDNIQEARLLLTQAEDDIEQASEAFDNGEYDEAVFLAKRALSRIEALPPYEEDGGEIDVPLNCPLTATELADITNFPPPTGPIVALGDSLTAGVGATFGQDYVSELEVLTGENIINAGVSGDTTEEALARLQRDVLNYDPATVIVWLGGNDFLARYYQEIENQTQDTFLERLIAAFFEFIGKDPRNEDVITEDETFANLETIVERIQDSGAVVVLVGMDGEPVEDNLNARYQAVAEETGAIYVEDVMDGIIGRPSLTSDLIHPNNAGYELVARRIYPAVACTL